MSTEYRPPAYAFPAVTVSPSGLIDIHAHGLTKREYFAAMALQGLAANSVTKLLDPAEAAKGAVLFADYLIAALNKQETP